MIVRAFLSHGEPDKGLVRKVAEYLGRAAVVFDVYEFATGDDLKKAILKGFSRSDLFVLFASKASLERPWVRFEITEAQKAIALQTLSGALTYVVDPDLSFDEIPEWMRTTIISRQSSPVLIAKDIQRVIGERLEESRPKYFVGRAVESQEALEAIASFADPAYRPPLFVYGLNGIGRRTLVRDVGRNFLSYPKTLEITLREGDLLPELLLKVTSATARHPIGNPQTFIAHHAGRSPRELVTDIVDSFISICGTSTLPVILDQGAISTEEGVLQSDFDLLCSTIAAEPRVDCVLITNKRLHPVTGGSFPSVRVSELSQAATASLIRLMARDRGLRLSPTETESISQYSRGYPPAIMLR